MSAAVGADARTGSVRRGGTVVRVLAALVVLLTFFADLVIDVQTPIPG